MRVEPLLLLVLLSGVLSTEFSFQCLESNVNLHTARKLCEGQGRKLVTIRNENEDKELRTLMRTESCTQTQNILLPVSRAQMKNSWADFPPQNLIDGNLSNFAHTYAVSNGVWIRVQLAVRSSVTRVEVYNRLECCQDRIVGLLVYIKSGEEYVKTCSTFSGAHTSYTFYCTGIGDVVELSKEGLVGEQNIAEIRVYGTTASGQETQNILLPVSRAQMKNSWDDYPPPNLIDGNLSNFAHTYAVSNGVWIRVHLAVRSSVTRVEVYNRHDCCQDRIVGLLVYIKSGEEYVKTCGTFSGAHTSYTFYCTGIGDVVELSKEGLVGEQNIAEIRVYGTAVSGQDRVKIYHRRAWLNYEDGKWADDSGYPMLYSNWRDGRVPSLCASFANHGWIQRKCGSKSGNVLLCENRVDEDAGEYGILIKHGTTISSIASITGAHGISATFSVHGSLTLEVLEDEIKVFCWNPHELNVLSHSTLTATANETILVNSLKTKHYPPISPHSEVKVTFTGESECVLYNVKVYDTATMVANETQTPTIGWQSSNWFIQGQYKYFTNTAIMTSFYCKEGTYMSSTRSECHKCPAGSYQNLQNMPSCKACPDRYTSRETGQTVCTCHGASCTFEEEGATRASEAPTDNPHKEDEEVEEVTVAIDDTSTTARPVTPNKTEPDILIYTTKSPRKTEPRKTEPIQVATDPKTQPPPETTPERCPAEIITDENYGQYKWKLTEAGGIDTNKCTYNLHNQTMWAQRKCSQVNVTVAMWEVPDYTECVTKKDLEILEMTSFEVTSENVAGVTDNLKGMTEDMSSVSSSGIEATVNAMGALQSHVKPEDTKAILDIGSNLLDASEEKLSNNKESLQKAITNIAASMSTIDSDQKIVSKNVDIITVKLKPNKPAKLISNDTDIYIPKSITSLSSGAFVVVYKTAKLFKPAEESEKMTVIADLHFSGIEVNEAKEDIKLAFKDIYSWTVNESQKVNCVFWNKEQWDDYGCRYDENVKACFCNHATAFTAILSFQKTNLSETVENDAVVWYTEVICFSVSILSCICFIIIILSIRGLRRLQSFKMHCNLAVALLLQYTGYLTLDLIDVQGMHCKAIGILVHWITLACFLAMLAEALSVYFAIVIVFDSHVSRIVIKVVLFCWGIPGCIVGVFAGVTKMEYYNCYSGGPLIPPYKWYFLSLPVLCILLVNTVLFGIVTYKTIRQQMERSNDGFGKAQVYSQFKMSFTLNSMLGIGFLIGLVAQFSVALKIIYIIVNGLAGLFLLCLFGIFNPMTRKAVQKSMAVKTRTRVTTGSNSTYMYKLTAQSYVE